MVPESIFDRVRRLKLPAGQYVVVGGAMEAYGIRKANDIDIVVTEKLFQQLVADGWEVCMCETCLEMRLNGAKKRILKKPGVDIISEYSWYDKYSAETIKLIQDAVMIDGVPFVQLESLLKWKKAAGRPKDMLDIKLIEEYLL